MPDMVLFVMIVMLGMMLAVMLYMVFPMMGDLDDLTMTVIATGLCDICA